MNRIKKSIIRQLLFFLIYLLIISLVVLNNKGGGDIFFMIIMKIAVSIHILLISYKLVLDLDKENKKFNKYDLLTIIIISVFTFLFINEYLSLISKFK